jgi:hypothetical protein
LKRQRANRDELHSSPLRSRKTAAPLKGHDNASQTARLPPLRGLKDCGSIEGRHT